jgi:PhnB protein
MQLSPYLTFNGQCEAAFKAYERCLGGKIEMMMTHGESPMADQTPPESRDKILHASLIVGDNLLMGSDCGDEHQEQLKGFSVSINVKDQAEAERIYNELSENGQVRMPLQKTFWASKFAMFVDRFGVPWMINCE